MKIEIKLIKIEFEMEDLRTGEELKKEVIIAVNTMDPEEEHLKEDEQIELFRKMGYGVLVTTELDTATKEWDVEDLWNEIKSKEQEETT